VLAYVNVFGNLFSIPFSLAEFIGSSNGSISLVLSLSSFVVSSVISLWLLAIAGKTLYAVHGLDENNTIAGILIGAVPFAVFILIIEFLNILPTRNNFFSL
jgi:hypothetical protein